MWVLWTIFILIVIAFIGYQIWKKDHTQSDQIKIGQASEETPQLAELSENDSTRAEKPGLKKESFYVAGTYYHMDGINQLRTPNPDWRKSGKTLASEGKAMEQIPHYFYADKPIKLVPEPTNEHDKNAIKVLIAGEFVGYISQDENVHVGNILKSHEIKYIYARFKGGEYKVVSEDGTAVKMENHVGIVLYLGYI